MIKMILSGAVCIGVACLVIISSIVTPPTTTTPDCCSAVVTPFDIDDLDERRD